jgi:UDP-N-acetylglucosamine--N-acetylmuramyl-(pentapeptide) pyrophosphoryl-undecaprenol N-acetylglucosamine transferase
MKVLFTCGGTGGHIMPAVAVAHIIQERRPGSTVVFVGATGGMEEKLVPREGFKLLTVDIGNLRRSIKPSALKHNITLPARVIRSRKQARAILQAEKPDVVVGTGGYACYPVLKEAAAMGIPTALHESNEKPGLTTKMLYGHVDVLMLGFESGASRYKRVKRVAVTGTPVREAFIFGKKAEAKAALGLTGKPLVVSSWGSLGAREMNKIIAGMFALEDGSFYHIHATGSFGYRWMPEYVRNLGVDLKKNPGIDMREFIHDMPQVMAAADLVIGRAGALTLGEVVATAVPSILVPSPNVAGNHQEYNARAIENVGGAVIMKEKGLTAAALHARVKELLNDPARRASMSAALQRTAVLDAGARMYKIICELAGKP